MNSILGKLDYVLIDLILMIVFNKFHIVSNTLKN